MRGRVREQRNETEMFRHGKSRRVWSVSWNTLSKGQGEKNEDKIVKTETCKTRLGKENYVEPRHSIVTKTPNTKTQVMLNEDCIAFDFCKGLKKKNCRLYTVNKPRIGIKTDTGGAALYQYCVILRSVEMHAERRKILKCQ